MCSNALTRLVGSFLFLNELFFLASICWQTVQLPGFCYSFCMIKDPQMPYSLFVTSNYSHGRSYDAVFY
jgi:hypothetical protein